MAPYEPTWNSLAQHPVPDWFRNAKLGVLIVCGLSSVPGWAPLTGDFDVVVQNQGWETFFRENPYAEWYYNTIKFEDSPHKPGYRVKRDVAAELTAAVRARGMRMGMYYSGGLDWSYRDAMINDYTGVFEAVSQTEDYVNCVDTHWRELIDRYEPSVLWSDIALPAGSDCPGSLLTTITKSPMV